MEKAELVYTQYKNYFRVEIKNLEKLSIKQIQQLEEFVKKRNGFFDFHHYCFDIQKRIDFQTFQKLIEHSLIEANCKESIIEEENEERIGFGQYKGVAYSDLPDSYLLWLLSNYRGYDREKIEQEVQKRGL